VAQAACREAVAAPASAAAGPAAAAAAAAAGPATSHPPAARCVSRWLQKLACVPPLSPLRRAGRCRAAGRRAQIARLPPRPPRGQVGRPYRRTERAEAVAAGAAAAGSARAGPAAAAAAEAARRRRLRREAQEAPRRSRLRSKSAAQALNQPPSCGASQGSPNPATESRQGARTGLQRRRHAAGRGAHDEACAIVVHQRLNGLRRRACARRVMSAQQYSTLSSRRDAPCSGCGTRMCGGYPGGSGGAYGGSACCGGMPAWPAGAPNCPAGGPPGAPQSPAGGGG